MIRYLLLGITLAIVSVGTGLMLQDKSSPADRESRTSNPSIAGNEQQAPEINREVTPTLDNRVDNTSITDTKIADTRTDDTTIATLPWAENEDPITIPARFERLGITARALKINQNYFSSLSKGDKVLLPIPQLGQSYEMQVEQIQRHPNGDRSIKGHLLGTKLPYSFIMTEGTHSSFATINTPGGSYTLEAEGEDAWMVSLADLDFLIDINIEDYEIPDINRRN